MRFSKALFSLLICSCLTVPTSLLGQSISAVYIPNAIAGGGGTGSIGYPYAVYVRIQNWTAAANSQAYLKLYNGSFGNEYMWSASGAWSNSTTYSSSNQPVANIDGGGNWSGWIYAKHNDIIQSAASVRAARVGSTGTNLTSSPQKTFIVLTTTGAGNGGWIVRQSSPAVNKGILAYSGGAIVGSYRTEDNGIAEGYTYGAGGFKIAVPAGFVDSLVTIDDNGSRDQVLVGPWVINAGQETDAGAGGTPVGRGSAKVEPATLSGGTSQTLSVKIFGEAPYVIHYARVAVPSGWVWSHSTSSILVIGGGVPRAVVSGDTVVVSNFDLRAGDSLRVQISDVAPTDTTAYFVLSTMTGTSADSVYAISVQPSVFVYGTPLPVSVVKENDANGVPLRNNQLVTTRGIVVSAGQFGKVSYLQDNSGGLAVFDSMFAGTVAIGDEVIVSGLVQPFSGLTEIVNPMVHAIVTSGNTTEPIVVTASQIDRDGAGGVEVYEGRLVRINGVNVVGAGSWTANTNYQLYDRTDTTQLRIDKYNTDLPGLPIPASAFDVIGVVGQFISSSPYIGGYQILPRFRSDILSSGPIFVSLPIESTILPNSLTVTWETLNQGSSRVQYGKTPARELGIVGNDILKTKHSIQLAGLDPATIYYIRAFSVAGKDTSAASTFIASTASSSLTTGRINVCFNKSVNTSLSWFQPALGNQDLVLNLLSRIRSARRSIDAALYSLSGDPGANIATELVLAKQRGVSVRVICEYDNRNGSGFVTLRANGIAVVDDRFDPVNAGAGLMHNKFFVIDGRGGSPDSVWVWTGSWNPTQAGTYDDYQNAVEIQDGALAGAYTIEFNEMWGNNTEVPNASVSRFGLRKTDNTPHRFVVGGREVECYFSPSDRTTSHILSAINGAQHSVAVNLLTLTRTDIASALVAKKHAGIKVRGVLDNNSDSGSQFNYLVANGVDVRLKAGTTGLLHHKYGLVDAENPYWNSIMMTGSHNWSSSAESSNNENLVLIKDGNIANQFLQEFAARYYQFGGSDTIAVSVQQVDDNVPVAFSLSQNYPNPFNPVTSFQFSIVNPHLTHGARNGGQGQLTTVKVYDVLGREVATLVNEVKAPGSYVVTWDATTMSSGVYYCRLLSGSFTSVVKMLLIR